MIEPLLLYVIGVAIIALRTYARVRVIGWKHLQSDDYIMFFVALFYTGGTALVFVSCTYWHALNNGGMTSEERATLDPMSEEYQWRVNGSKAYIAIWVSYTLVLWLQKVAVLAFFIRLMSSLGDYTQVIRFGFLMVVVSYVAIMLCFFLDCLPVERAWQINPDPGSSCVPSDITTLSVVLTLNILTDLYIFAIPLPMLWMAHIKLWKKLGLLVLISGNVFIIAAAITRVCIIAGDTLHGSKLAAPWTFRVMFVSVVSTNAPLLAPLLRQWCGYLSVLLFGKKSSKNRMMRDLQTITVVDCTDEGEAPAAEQAFSGRTRPLFTGTKGKQPSAITYGSGTMVSTDDGGSEKIMAVLEVGMRDYGRRPPPKPSLSEEHPV